MLLVRVKRQIVGVIMKQDNINKNNTLENSFIKVY